ncbi:HAD family hydrolase [Actinokineospora terrae]|uniref:HAD-superfamily subfamily IB hydrolase, TIGR01490 n=1 Tax=Actinokineospora terrae TaxID=155974 RepID=A0A1H9LPX1_9PSEU|nr:HAD-IB family hydrolase [Actinokineospora terrae]SER13205.1 HAD-superfamily subfamily IB hydrolase, TIGR01490 [Actinokineospora terrae]
MSRAAFFDVDGTLITVTSLFRFLAFDRAEDEYGTVMADLAGVKAAGATREEANRFFYRAFAGRPAADLAALGERWFAAEYARGGLFDPRVLTMLRAHRAAGDTVVLLSGSFGPCLTPIARYACADAVVCTEPEVVSGVLSGVVAVPMVGPNKAVAARRFAEEHGIDLSDSFAYGDDISDLPVLDLVGCPVVVGGDPALRAHAERVGWRRIPAHTREEVLCPSR